MKFEILIDAITLTHSHFQQQASKAVNVSLTLKNWLIGFYIVEFELHSDSIAMYGFRQTALFMPDVFFNLIVGTATPQSESLQKVGTAK